MSAPQHPSIGLLPFYLKLYDDAMPERRAGFDGLLAGVAAAFEARGIAVVRAPVCRVAAEFEAAVARFEAAGVDAVATLHLAYSPSLEALEALCRTRLPVIVLDTTPDPSFGRGTPPDRIMYNHGVHGVMDFTSRLRRSGRPFEIVAGHAGNTRFLDRAAGLARAALAARALAASAALRVGPAFEGMGDFAVAEETLASRLGVRVRQAAIADLDAAVRTVADAEVAAEVARDRGRFDCELPEETHVRSVRVGLGLRRLVESAGCSALSVNFQIFDRRDRLANTMPFLEISKAMARGTGYAGEGDVLTAALVGALARAFGETTFTEVFCPDWAGNGLFLSHMGEISPSVAAGRPRVVERPFPFGNALKPAVLTCAVRPGPATFVNLAPGPGDTFRLLVAPVTVLPEDDGLHPDMRDVVRAWIRPAGSVPRFLESYSHAGGTHHSALVLGDCAEAIAAFGRMCALDVVAIGA
jgi:L-arabinose isomerase